MVLPRKAWESKTHLIIQQIFMQQIFVSYWRLKDEKNRVLTFIKISVWIMVIILSPTLFLHSEPLVSHTPWKMPTSHSVPFFEDKLALPLVYHPSSFFKENSWVCFFLSWEGRHMYQTVSICIVIFLISRLSLNQPPLPDNLPQRQSKVAGHLVKKKKKKSWETHRSIYLASIATVCWWLLHCKAVTGQNWAKKTMQMWRKRNREQRGWRWS